MGWVTGGHDLMNKEVCSTESADGSTADRTECSRRLRVPRSLILRLGRLLYMEYRPSELAEELGCSIDSIYKMYLPAGCPHRRDDTGHVWIVGTQFSEWVRIALQKTKTPMAEGEAYCLKCNSPVKMQGPFQVTQTNRYLELVRGQCPICGTVVNRARARQAEDGE